MFVRRPFFEMMKRTLGTTPSSRIDKFPKKVQSQEKKKMVMPSVKVSDADSGYPLSSILRKFRETSPFARTGDSSDLFTKRLEYIQKFREKNPHGNQYKRKIHAVSAPKEPEVKTVHCSDFIQQESPKQKDLRQSVNHIPVPAASELRGRLSGLTDPQESYRPIGLSTRYLHSRLEHSRNMINVIGSMQNNSKDDDSYFKTISARILREKVKLMQDALEVEKMNRLRLTPPPPAPPPPVVDNGDTLKPSQISCVHKQRKNNPKKKVSDKRSDCKLPSRQDALEGSGLVKTEQTQMNQSNYRSPVGPYEKKQNDVKTIYSYSNNNSFPCQSSTDVFPKLNLPTTNYPKKSSPYKVRQPKGKSNYYYYYY